MATRENKFARLKAQNKNLARENVVTVDEQLTRLEDDARRLKVEFDIFLSGGAKRPPYDTKNRVESTIKRIADDRSLTFAQRYRYNSLVARYTSLRDVWRRTMQDRESGRARFAPSARSNNAVNNINAPTEQQQPTAEIAPPPAAEATSNSTFVCTDGHSEVAKVRELYDALVTAKAKNGETDGALSFPRFHHLIATKTDDLKENHGCARVRFSVEIEDGRVNLKANADD